MQKVDPTTVEFSDIPREIRDIIYSLALPTFKTLSVHDDCPPFNPVGKPEVLEITGISFIELDPDYPYFDDPVVVRSNLIFVSRTVNAKILTTFFETNTFGLSHGNILTCYLTMLRPNKVTQLLKYRVAAAIGSLATITSSWVRRIELRVCYLSAALRIWLCRHRIPELQ